MRRTLLALAIIAPLFNPGLLDSIGNLLAPIWGATGDEGCIWDPYGGCRPAPEPRPSAGCIWDPDGSPCNQGS